MNLRQASVKRRLVTLIHLLLFGFERPKRSLNNRLRRYEGALLGL